MKAVIIGNGIAGVTAASALRSLQSDTHMLAIDMFSDEEYPYYTRVRLPEFVAGSVERNALFLYKDQWYADRSISVHTRMRAESIDTQNKTVRFVSGDTVAYDVLILATGASANRCTVDGSDLNGIYTLRSLADAEAVVQNVRDFPGNGAVIGGGLLGLEAARGLKSAGVKQLHVFEVAPRLLPRQLDEEGAALLSERLRGIGLEVITSAELLRFTSGDAVSSHVTALSLKDGRTFPSETVVLSMGVRPNTALAAGAGLAVNRGILTDSHMQTSDPAIFAAGDCAEFGGVVWGIIPAALEQAPVAAASAWAYLCTLSGKPGQGGKEYTQTVPKTALKVADIDLQSIGKAVLTPEEAASPLYDEYRHSSGAKGAERYEKYVVRNDETGPVLCGAILYGSREHQAAAASLINKPIAKEKIEELLNF